MATAMLIEDSPSDVSKALMVLRKLGIAEPLIFTRVDLAVLYLQEVVDGTRSAPDLIILDLEFSAESGFEVLRLWRANQALRSIRIIVWTGMGDLQKELSRLLGVEVVAKPDGLHDLERVVKAA